MYTYVCWFLPPKMCSTFSRNGISSLQVIFQAPKESDLILNIPNFESKICRIFVAKILVLNTESQALSGIYFVELEMIRLILVFEMQIYIVYTI